MALRDATTMLEKRAVFIVRRIVWGDLMRLTVGAAPFKAQLRYPSRNYSISGVPVWTTNVFRSDAAAL